MTFANFFRAFFKQDAVTTCDGCARQVGVFVFTATEQAKKMPLFLLAFTVAGRGGCGRISQSCSFLQSPLSPSVQLTDRTLEPINRRGIELLGLVVLVSQLIYFGGYR